MIYLKVRKRESVTITSCWHSCLIATETERADWSVVEDMDGPDLYVVSGVSHPIHLISPLFRTNIVHAEPETRHDTHQHSDSP